MVKSCPCVIIDISLSMVFFSNSIQYPRPVSLKMFIPSKSTFSFLITFIPILPALLSVTNEEGMKNAL